ncbi:hypothetical protein [Kitasatospora sp. NPDC096140]
MERRGIDPSKDDVPAEFQDGAWLGHWRAAARASRRASGSVVVGCGPP